MINVSKEFKECIQNDKKNYLAYLDITLKNGMILDTVTNSDLWEGGFKIDDGVTPSGQFTIGSCIINKLTVTLNNIYDKFSAYDFNGAIVNAYLGLELPSGKIEKIRKGVFTVDEPTYNGATITLECLDNMHKLDRDYSEVGTTYPTTIRNIARDICSVCGVTLLTTTFDNDGFVVQTRPNDEALTCRQMLGYCAQIACKFARCDVYGRACLGWFDQEVFEASDNLDGGDFQVAKTVPGFKNIFLGSGESVYSAERLVRRFITPNLKPDTTYTIVMNGKTFNSNSYIAVYDQTSEMKLGGFSKGQNGAERIVIRTRPGVEIDRLNFWVMPGANAYRSVIYWACLYEGDVDAPLQWIPGENDNQYEIGMCADGGNFADYGTGDNIDGGTFEDFTRFHHLYAMSSLTVTTDDVVITGIQVTEEFDETETQKKQTYFGGEKGYVLAVSGNKLIQAPSGTRKPAEEVLNYLKDRLVGLRFRPLNGSFVSDPTVEAGDIAYITDRKQRTYLCAITNLTFIVGSYMSISCDAETPAKNSATRYSEMTQAIVQARRNAEKQLSEYDKAVQQLASVITQSFGIYRSEEVLADGSVIQYMHDKPTLAESKAIWKMTADAFAVSNDGGKTWTAGIDKNGNAVMNVLSVTGINFEWARGTDLLLGGLNNANGIAKVINVDGSYVLMDGNGLQHYDSGNKTFYHYLNKTGSVTISSFSSNTYKGIATITLPSAFKGKDITFTPYIQGVELKTDGTLSGRLAALSKLAMSTEINKTTGVVTLTVECRALHMQNEVDGVLYPTEYATPKSVTVAYTAIA